MKQRLFHPFNFFLSIMLMILVSCVGTIEDTSEPGYEAEGGKVVPAKYTGILGVKPISDTRVEIYFSQAPGNQSSYIYEIYKDNSKAPIEVRYDALRKNATGQLTYTYSGLDPSTTYAFSVEFYDLTKSLRSKATNPALNATTLSNQMCDFDGIVDARNANGLAALSTINIYWFPAKDSGFVVSSEDYDPVRYEVIGIAQSEGGIARINDPTANRIVKTVDSGTSFTFLSGLETGESYFFQVRCIHTGWKNKGFLGFSETTIGTYSREANNRFIEIATKSVGSTPEFAGVVEVINPLNANQANTQLSVQWDPATGGFADYRVFYYRDTPVDLGDGSYDEDEMNAIDHLTDDLMDEMVGDPADYTTSCLTGTPTCGHVQVPAEDISTTLTSLTQYGYYQVKVAACINAACDLANRISSDLFLKRVVPNIMPFNGITGITDPNPVVDDSRVTLQFAPPLNDAGFANDFVIKCYQGVNDPNPVAFTNDSDGSSPGTALTATGKSECENLALHTEILDWENMDDMEGIDVVGLSVNSNTNYCFSIYPVIDNTVGGLRYVKSGEENAIIQCITPTVKGPAVQEFAGRRLDVCDYDPHANELTVRWPEPSGGFYTDFQVVWKEFNPESEIADIKSPLNFQKAIDLDDLEGDVQKDGDNDGVYSGTIYHSDLVAGNLKEYTISSAGLIPGRKYQVGVIPTFVLGGVRQYGEFNTNVRECAIPLPKVEFNEWTNIVAIGPKVDGRRPSSSNNLENKWKTPRIFETLDEHGVPVEVELEDNSNDPVDADLRGNNVLFDGVYGKRDGNIDFAAGPHLYSNSGIIRLEFKDILVDENGTGPSFFDDKNTFHKLREYFLDTFADFDRDKEDFQDGIDDENDVASNKVDRTIGYKIFRSDDNKLTWIDLTESSDKNEFQREANNGLIYSKPVMYFKKNGRDSAIERRVKFTDYSVRHIEDENGIVSRGRVYWYKVVPYLDNKPLTYNGPAGHHIMRVVLPPPNMAFVSRMMANRQACIEIGKADLIRKGDGQYYTCPYNGIGARGMSRPWNTSDTYLDLGGDLLVDRFELGCNWTRGDVTEGSPDSSLADEVVADEGKLFDVYKDFTVDSGLDSSPLKGCFQVGSQTMGAGYGFDDEPTNYRPANLGNETETVGGEEVIISEQLEYNQVIPGDCFGRNERRFFSGSAAACNNIETNPNRRGQNNGSRYIYPGAFENTNGFKIDEDGTGCQASMTTENHNAHPSLPYNNKELTFPSDVTNMDPFQAQSEYAAVFYMRERNHTGHYIRTLGRYFSANSAAAPDNENRYLESGIQDNPSSCYINLFGINTVDGASEIEGHLTDVRPRWLSLSEVLRDMEVREVARTDDNNVAAGTKIADVDAVIDRTLADVMSDSNMYGGDWEAPAENKVVGINEKRINSSMTIGRIMTANSAKLPPIEGLAQSEYNKVCSLYSVEIGYLQENGNFVRDYPGIGADPIKKRLPRRKEFVAFSAWPDSYAEATVITLEKGALEDGGGNIYADILAALSRPKSSVTKEAIDPDTPNADPDKATIESEYLTKLASWENKSCVTKTRFADNGHVIDNYYSAITAGDAVGKNRFKYLHPTFPLSESTDDPVLWSGSSSLDHSIYNSERCVSRYGIQDHIGNYREVGTDQFWCDPLAHEFKLEDPNQLNLLTHGYSYFKQDNFPNWENQRPNTGEPFGECSIRAPGNDTGDDVSLSGNMVSIYDDFTQTSPNTGLLPRVNNVDLASVLQMRNGGDGEFLSFGESEIAPTLFHSKGVNRDNLSLKRSDHSDAFYFSPVLGIPLKCAQTSCSTSEDNLLVTSPVFHGNLIANGVITEASCQDQIDNDGSFKTKDCSFPLGNAEIDNHSTDLYYTRQITYYKTTNENSARNDYSHVFNSDYFVGADGSGYPIYQSDKDGTLGPTGLPSNVVGVTSGLEGDLNDDGSVDYLDGDLWIDSLTGAELSGADYLRLTQIRPINDGSTAGMFINGGGTNSNEDEPGRYALSITMENISHQKYENTARCMLMIYGDEY